MNIPLTNLRAFDAVARLLSFTLAAEELHLSQSAISQQIKQLEERLDFKLFRRMTRRLELTENGRRLYETVRRSIHDIDSTVAELRDAAAQGTVTISVGSSFAANWLIPRLDGFGIDCPGIDLRIKPSDALADLHADPTIDIAVRFAQGPGRGLVAESLGAEQVFVVCSPSLLEGRKPPEALRDLCEFPLLHNEVSDQEAGAAGDWANWLADLGEEDALDVRPGPRIPRSDLLVQAAIHGQGLALVWTTMVRNELRDGRLVKMFNGRHEASNSYYASCTEDAYAKPKVRAVMDWMTDKALRMKL
jgi:LysR family glycine cleavage system transcriptional activator